MCQIISKFLINRSRLKLKVYFLIILTLIIFSTRNIIRIEKEYQLYNYNILTNPFYRLEEQNFSIFNKINDINNCHLGTKTMQCKKQNIQLKKINNHKIYFRKN